MAVDRRWLPGSAALAAIVQRIQNRGAIATVKFVETAEALDAARAAGADLVQGYYVGQPLPAPEIARLTQPDVA